MKGLNLFCRFSAGWYFKKTLGQGFQLTVYPYNVHLKLFYFLCKVCPYQDSLDSRSWLWCLYTIYCFFFAKSGLISSVGVKTVILFTKLKLSFKLKLLWSISDYFLYESESTWVWSLLFLKAFFPETKMSLSINATASSVGT